MGMMVMMMMVGRERGLSRRGEAMRCDAACMMHDARGTKRQGSDVTLTRRNGGRGERGGREGFMAVLGHRWLAGAYMAAGGGVAGGEGGGRSDRGA